MKKHFGEYYLGLDIGTNSVGWAVTDNQYQIQKLNGKALWGIRLFEEAEKAEDRRMYRSARRRIQRKEDRIKILQELFAEEIAKVDVGFYQRLRDSKYYQEDKYIQQANTLFNDESYTDREYHKEFPTIYHLRKALIEGNRQYDIRLVYLALHHIIKHRGHFLFEGQEMKNVTSFDNVYEELIQCLGDNFDRVDIDCSSIESVKAVLTSREMTKTDKEKKLKELFAVEKSDKQMIAVVGLLAGTTKKLSDLYNDKSLDENEKTKVCFSDAGYEDTRMELDSVLQEKAYVLDKLKAVYDWAVLTDILQGEQYLSYAKVEIYEKHKSDLQILKKCIRKYCPELNKEILKKVGKNLANYCSYVGMAKKNNRKVYVENHCMQEELCAYLLKIFDKIEGNDNDLTYMKQELKSNSFLPKQRSKDNGVIPYQVHEVELKEILNHASKYLVFLSAKDETGYTVCEKIEKTFRFRIPYYVGPLNSAHREKGANNWIVKKADAKITPWNFEQIVDLEASAEAFITRMTNKCTYLVGEDVLPKNSILYSEYMVLNEINNIRINQEKIPVSLKQSIYTDLFMKYRKVTKKRLCAYLKTQGYELEEDSLSGFDGDFKSSMSSYLDFKDILGSKMDNYEYQQMAEQIILWSCLYGDDKKLLVNKIRKQYEGKLSVDEIKKIGRKKYTGWGRFSRTFLCGIEGASKETGEIRSIIQSMRETNDNLMMLLSQNYTYLETIEKFNHIEDKVTEISYELVEDLYVSPSVKHMLWQTLKVVKELGEILGHEPKKVFIEMARGEDAVKERKDSRKKRLSDLYKACKMEGRDWCKEIDSRSEGDFRGDRLYLYYTQNGRCMYTGHKISLEKLFDKNLYDIDHIYPQSKTKDDSLDNRVLVERTANAKKDNIYPLDKTIQQKQIGFWRSLKDKNFITQKKYDRLIRTTDFSDQELAGFIARQLVETQQTMKATADLLKKVYDESEIVYVKARLVSDFRHDYSMLKVREVNDYHHAKDAYLNIVVGNVYNTKFTNNPVNFVEKNRNKNYSIARVFDWKVERGGYVAWTAGETGTIGRVKQTMQKNNILYTRASFEGKGGLFNQTLYDKHTCAAGNGYIPLKSGDARMQDISRYGGYGTVTGAYFFAVEHTYKKGKRIRTIETVPAYLKQKLQDEEALKRYCEEVLDLSEVRILVKKINMQSLIKVNGFYLHLTGRSNVQLSVRGAVQLCISSVDCNYIKKLSNFVQRNTEARDSLEITEFDKITSEQNINLYRKLTEKHCNTIYSKRPNSTGKILREGYDKFKNLSVKQQTKQLMQILQLTQCCNLGADLSLIGGAKKSGVMLISKEISKNNEFKLINQSPTGVFETEIDLRSI